MLLTVVSFIVALGILIAVHEWGHYRVAVACGVKVLRYSIGFGKPLLRWTSKKSGTEYVIAALPLGAMCACSTSAKPRSAPRKGIWPSTTSPCVHAPPLWLQDRLPTWCWRLLC